MAKKSVEDIVELFNDGKLDVKSYFGDYETFFSFLDKSGGLHLVDPVNGPDADVWENEYLLWQFEHDKPGFLRNVIRILGDVELENGRVYLVGDDLGELSKLFCDRYRNTISIETITTILNGEYDSDFYSSTTEDVYRDVIEELTPKNMQRLYDYIVKTLEGQQISPETEVLEIIAEEQGHPEYVTVDAQTVIKIVDDEETMKSLLNDELSDLQSELYSHHSSAYNSAYSDEIYEDILSKLDEYFIMNEREWSSRPHAYKKNTNVQTFKVPINNFEDYVYNYLENNKGYTSGNLSYWGSYLSLLANEQECLSYYPPDYPDSHKVDKYINEYFSDYI